MKYDQRFFNSFDTCDGAISMTSGFQVTSPSSLNPELGKVYTFTK